MVSPVHPHWSAIWVDLLNRAKDSDALFSLGETWLRNSAGKAVVWGSVWRALWDRSPRDPSLITSAISGLQGTVCDAGTWKSVWRTLFPCVGSGNQELLSATVQRLRGTASQPEQEVFWIEAARSQGSRTRRELARHLDWPGRLFGSMPPPAEEETADAGTFAGGART